jgi:hypothetical protein
MLENKHMPINKTTCTRTVSIAAGRNFTKEMGGRGMPELKLPKLLAVE